MWKRIARRRYERALVALGRGDVDSVLAQFAHDVRFHFAGDSALGATLRSRDAVKVWFDRLFRLLPAPRFEAQDVVVDGAPWDFRIAARVLIRSSVAGAPYENEFCQFVRFRWGRVVADWVLEDTQRFERACTRLVAAGIEEAAAPPIDGPVG